MKWITDLIYEEFDDTKEVIRIRKSKDRQLNGQKKDRQLNDQKKDRQRNDQKKKDKKTNNDLQNIAQKTKDQVTRTTLYYMLLSITL